MKIAFLSDLHLAPPDSNRCSVSDRELLALFDEVEEQADRVVVNGDLFDLSRAPKLFGWREQLEATRNAHPEVYDRLTRYDWTYGNHDEGLRHLGIPERLRIHTETMKVVALHGHQWDGPLKKAPLLADVGNFAAGWLHRAGLPGAGVMLGHAAYRLDALKSNGDPSLDGASSLIEEGWDVVVQGHSHLLRLHAHEGGLFINTGSLCEESMDWALLDTEAGRAWCVRDGEVVAEARRERGWRVETRG